MQTNPRYWLLSDGTPLGPFDASEIQAKLATAEFTPAMKFCRVGDREWLPPANFPAHAADSNDIIALSAEPAATPIEEPALAGSVDLDRGASPSPANPWTGYEAVIGGVALAGLVLLIGLICWWLTPLTPRNVVERFVAADTLSDQLKYSTANLHPALRALESLDDTSDPADRFELTQDRPAPVAIGGHYVGCSFRFRDAETKQITHGAGFFHLIETDGWKIEDLYFSAVNGEVLESPVSLAQNYRTFLAADPPKPIPSGSAGGSQPPNRFVVYAIGRAIFNWLQGGGGGKLLAGLALAVLVAIGSLFTRHKSDGGTSSNQERAQASFREGRRLRLLFFMYRRFTHAVRLA